jgi:hypothetical protein
MTTYDPEHIIGHPGMVWYTTVTPTRGDQLQVGQWLDSLDHCGARTIHNITDAANGYRTVWFSNIDGDSETVRDDVMYDVVDPDSVTGPRSDERLLLLAHVGLSDRQPNAGWAHPTAQRLRSDPGTAPQTRRPPVLRNRGMFVLPTGRRDRVVRPA